MGEVAAAGQIQGPRGLASPSTVTAKVTKHISEKLLTRTLRIIRQYHESPK